MSLCFPFFCDSRFNRYAFERKNPYALLTNLLYSSAWFGVMPVESGICLSGWYIHAIFQEFVFTSCSVASPLILRIPRKSLLVSPTPSILFLLGGIGAALTSGVVDGIALYLAGGAGANVGG